MESKDIKFSFDQLEKEKPFFKVDASSSNEKEESLNKKSSLAFDPTKAKVLPAQNFSQFYKACKLVHDEYFEAGLANKKFSGIRFYLRELLPDSTTFVSLVDEKVVATVTVIRWSMASVPAFNIYREELEGLCKSNKFFAEATKFASVARKISGLKEKRKPVVIFEELLKTIFHWCGCLGVDYWVSVIHPRQIPYYTKKLGFEAVDNVKDCEHVSDNPGVLIKLNIRKLLNGKVKPIKYLKNRMLEIKPDISRFQNYHFLTSEEVAFLLLEHLEAFQDASFAEKNILEFHYPGVLEEIESYCIEYDFKKSSTYDHSILKCVTPFIPELENVQSDKTMSSDKIFDLRQLLRKIEIIAKIHSRKNSVAFNININRLSGSLYYGNYEKIGYLLCTLIVAAMKDESLLELEFDVDYLKKDAGKSLLRIRFITTDKIKLNNTDKTLLDFPVRIWSSKTHNSKWLNTVSIPIKEMKKSEDESSAGSLIINYRMSEKCKILLAEENLLDQLATERILQKRGYEVLTAASGSTAIDLIKNNNVDLALIDVSLPGIDGLSLTYKLRNEYGLKIPIIAFTASVREKDRAKIFRAGMNDLFIKPQSIKKLYDIIEYHLAHNNIIDGIPHMFRVA